MALVKVTYTDNVTTIYAANMNGIQDEIIANGTAIQNEMSQRAYQDLQLETKVNAIEYETITDAEIEALF